MIMSDASSTERNCGRHTRPARARFLFVSFFAVTPLLLLSLTAVSIRYWPRESLQQQIASSTAVFDRKQRLLRLTLARDEQYRLWTSLEDVSPELVEALLLHEDRH